MSNNYLLIDSFWKYQNGAILLNTCYVNEVMRNDAFGIKLNGDVLDFTFSIHSASVPELLCCMLKVEEATRVDLQVLVDNCNFDIYR